MTTTRTSFPRILSLFLAILFVFSAFVMMAPGAHACYYSTCSSKSSQIDYLMIVNQDHPHEFGSDYDQAIKANLVYLPDAYGDATPLERATAQAFQQLEAAMKRKGLPIALYSGYRTAADQQAVYDYYASLPGWSESNDIALPGYSEHHTGLLLNIVIWYGENGATPQWYTETAERQRTIPEFRLLHQTLADYGFIDRYPAGKESITGISCEPYEIRYVGDSRIAHEIMDGHLCLEEYVARQAEKQAAKDSCKQTGKQIQQAVYTRTTTAVAKCYKTVCTTVVTGIRNLCTALWKYR